MKVLFLDVDGVLNTYRTQVLVDNRYTPYISDLEPECMANLVLLLDAHPDLRILISSAWREEIRDYQFKELFHKLGYPTIADRIFGVTNPKLSKADAIAESIQILNLKEFVIIDDDILFPLNHELNKHQYKTSLYSGLLSEDIVKISYRLNEMGV